MAQELTERTYRLIELIDDPETRAGVIALLEGDALFHAPPGKRGLGDRVRFAVIKLAMRGPEMYRVAVELLHADWRDLLMNAEFADDVEAHDKWCRSLLDR